MKRKSAAYPGIGDWVALVAAALLSIALLLGGTSTRYRVAELLRSSVLYPFRLVSSYAAQPVDPERELTRLRRQLARNRIDAAAQRAALRENERLRRLLDFVEGREHRLLPALVVGRSADRFGEVLTLGRGREDGVFAGQTVIGIEGLVGVVTGTEGGECWARTLRHGAVPVSGLLTATRYVGLLRWSPERQLLRFEGIPVHHDLQVGEEVETSGHGRIFPKGIPVGTVVSVADDRTGLLKEIYVRPHVDLDRIEEVFLQVPAPPDSSATATEG